MKALNRQVELAYMVKVLSQGPQYMVYAIGVCAIALVAAVGGLDEKTPTASVAKSATMPMVATVANYSPATNLPGAAKR